MGGIIPTTLDEHAMRDVVVDVVVEGWTSSRGISRRDSVIFYCVVDAVVCCGCGGFTRVLFEAGDLCGAGMYPSTLLLKACLVQTCLSE